MSGRAPTILAQVREPLVERIAHAQALGLGQGQFQRLGVATGGQQHAGQGGAGSTSRVPSTVSVCISVASSW